MVEPREMSTWRLVGRADTVRHSPTRLPLYCMFILIDSTANAFIRETTPRGYQIPKGLTQRGKQDNTYAATHTTGGVKIGQPMQE